MDMAQASQMSLAELIDHFEWDMANKLQEDELQEDQIASATREENVVQVMTIHKSKGLNLTRFSFTLIETQKLPKNIGLLPIKRGPKNLSV